MLLNSVSKLTIECFLKPLFSKKIKNGYWQKHLEQKHPTTYEDESFVCYKCDILHLDQEEMDRHNAKIHANDLACLNCGMYLKEIFW